MAVVQHKLAYSGPSGSKTAKGQSYVSTYLIETDDPLDGPKTVLDYVESSIVAINDTYTHGNDSDPQSFCHEITVPQHRDGSATWWEVTAKFEPLSAQDDNGNGDGRDTDGEKTSDKKDEAPKISIRYALEQGIAEKATYRGGFTHAPAIVADGDVIVPMSSSTEPFDPPLEKDQPIQVIRIKKTLDKWDGDTADVYFNATNSAKLTWKAWVDATQTFQPRTLKITAIEADHRYVGDGANKWDWDVSIELHYKPSGWRVEVPDRGFKRIARAGDPDGRGGTISPSDLPQGVMQMAVPVDFDGVSNNGPVLLDGAGNPLAPGTDPVFIKYQLYTEANILNCPGLDEALEAAP